MIRFALLAAALAMPLSACHTDPFSVKPEVKIDPNKVKASKAAPLAIDDPMNGRSVSVPVGETFVVSFKANVTTPVRWNWALEGGEGVELVSDTYSTDTSSLPAGMPPPPGMGGRRTYTFVRTSAGPTSMVFTHADGETVYETVRINVITE